MSKLIRSLLAAATLSAAANPSDLEFTKFSGSDLTPSPACLAAAPTGEVFVGVDLLGSLGKGPGKGRIVRLVDSNNDGKPDQHTIFAEIDNPRGLIPIGDQLFVLHTVIPKDTGILSGMHLSVLEDKNQDGIADGPPKILVRDISVPKHNQDRGADHTTNGIRMGIDGWIYIAVGDFGFVNAQGTDGTTLTLLGGGIFRVRPDGSEFEPYTFGLRNIYDVAIDPYLNIFTRGNTNDGGGWNIRFLHNIQTGQYGYPMLFKNFTDEIIPALADLGGGSGTGALFLDEPTWPEKYNQIPMMADWGRNQIAIHRVTPDGPTFTQKAENFITISQPSDLDVDGSGRLYISAWEGAGYKGNPDRGFVERVVPKGWTYQPFPDLTKLETLPLTHGLTSPSATARLATQQEILRRNDPAYAAPILALANNTETPLASRVAALFTYKQLLGSAANPALLELAKDPSVQEFALRAATDRLTQLDQLPLEPFYEALKSTNPRVQAVAAVSLGRLGKKEAAQALLSVAIPPKAPTENIIEPQKPLFESKEISGNETVDIELDLLAVNNLYLIVEEASDGNGGDHAGWFDGVLTTRDGDKVPLAKMKWRSATQGWGKTLPNQSPNGHPLKRADGKPHQEGIGTHANSVIHYVIPGRMNKLNITAGLTSTAKKNSKVIFKLSSTPPNPVSTDEGPHATPNPDVVIPHLAINSLVSLRAIEASLAALDSPSQDGALRTLQLIHDPSVVDGLIQKYHSAQDPSLKNKILTALARLYTKEAPYDGSWWWRTQPDTRGPYYIPLLWQKSPEIETLFRQVFDSADENQKTFLANTATKHRMNLEGIGEVEKTKTQQVATIGQISIEDVMLALDDLKGNPANGQKILKTQACAACHRIAPDDPQRGPDLDKIGASLNREALAEAILKPDAIISKSWVDVIMNDGSINQGTLVEETDKKVTVRNIAGIPTTVQASDVKEIKTSASTLMGPHLLDALTLEEFADVIAHLHSLK